MKFEGQIWKDKKAKYWVVNVPLLDVTTQGTSQKNALEMVKDAIELEVDQAGFHVEVELTQDKDIFNISANEPDTLIAFMLKRQRQAHGLTIREVATRMHSKSANAYAQYERGTRHPTVSVLLSLMQAIDPKLIPVLKTSN
jgi:predicted RNase H-like HicB family nuclease